MLFRLNNSEVLLSEQSNDQKTTRILSKSLDRGGKWPASN